MIKGEKKIILEGHEYKAKVIEYPGIPSFTQIKKFYKKWFKYNKACKKMEGRGCNIPESLTEALYCYLTGNCRVSKVFGAKQSFDCYDEDTEERIQVKACSILPDLSSLGPKSVYDKFIFMDMSYKKNGRKKGDYKIYEIDTEILDNTHVNEQETVQDQREQGRRPRLSIYDKIIKEQNLVPIFEGNIFDD
jgi:hypothetical protein